LKTNNWVAGVLQIEKFLRETLKNAGVSKFGAVGDEFDSARHEVVATEKNSNVAAGKISAVLQTGFIFNGKVLRAAKVKIAE